MVRRKFLSTRLLQPGMVIDQSIIDNTKRVLVARKTPLDEYVIAALQRMSISGVYIREGEDESEAVEMTATADAQRVIDKNIKMDRSKVVLTESVKKRVTEGITMVFNQPDSVQVMGAADVISNDLMKTITENDAIAFDINALKISDEYTFKHSVDVASISMIIAKQMGLSQKDIKQIGMAGLLHDIGKTKVPIEVLNKPAKLTESEFEIVKQHSNHGYNILKDKPGITPEILLGVLQHHEKMDGKGYPMGATRDKIAPYARILAVADIYDALVTERPYKKGFTPRDSMEMIMAMTGELDINVIKAFINCVILYPVGTVVYLSNGEMAKVVENSKDFPARPTVVGLRSGKLYKLATDVNCTHLIIE